MATNDEEKQSLEAAKSSKTWRALRAASRFSLGLLDKVGPESSLQDVLKKEESTKDQSSDGEETAATAEGKVEEQIATV